MKRVLITLTICSSITSAGAAVPSSPFRTYPTSPYQANSLATQLRSAFPSDRLEVFAVGTASSVWAQSGEFELDYYQNQALVGAQWQINDKFSAEIKYQYSWAGNNGLDSVTLNFHDFFNISQNGREEAGKHQFTIKSDQYNIDLTDFEDEVMVSALHGYLQYQIFTSTFQSLAIGGTLYYNNVNDSPFNTDSFEQGLQLNYSILSGPHSIFSTLGVTHRSEDEVLKSLPVKSFNGAWALGYGYRFGYVHEMMLEYHGFSGALEDHSEFSKPSHEVVLGYKYYLNNAAFELSLTEMS